MNIVINVWELDKTHDPSEGMPITTILEYDKFNEPKVVGHGVPIERCKHEDDCLTVCLDTYPARIDTDPRFQTINLLCKRRAESYPNGYTLLDCDKGKGRILWTNPEIIVKA